MGSTTYSYDHYRARETARASVGVSAFAHDDAVKTGVARAAIHPELDIRGKIRESRDSAPHPRSKAIAVIFDNTGSMGDVPKLMQKKLPGLMALLLRKGYCVDPQILFGCVGDYNTDIAPLQIGQFESGAEMDDAFERMMLEGKGGGSNEESYELALYYFARKVSMDCFEQRGEKGLLFIIGDEKPYPRVDARQVEKVIGDKLQGELLTEQIVAELCERFDVFFIIPNNTSNFRNDTISKRWAGLIGSERVIKLEDPSAVCETIGATVGIMESGTGEPTIAADLHDIGASAATVRAVTASVGELARSVALARPGSGNLPARAGASGVERL